MDAKYKIPTWRRNTFAYDFKDASPELATYIPQENLLALAYLKHLRETVSHNKFSLVCTFEGRPRSGKSITAATIGCLFDDTFAENFEHRIVQNTAEFYDALERIEMQGITGAVIMIDEAGVSMSSADFFEKWLKVVFKTVQIFGYLHPIIFFVAPMRDFIDSRLRKMTNVHFRVKRYTNKATTLTPYEIEFSTIKSKYYYKKPRINLFGNEIILRRIIIGKPPQEIIERYAEIEKKRKTELMAGFRDDIRKEEIKEKQESVDTEKIVQYVIENFKNFETKKSSPTDIKIDSNKIRFAFRRSVTYRDADYIKDEVMIKLNEKNRVKMNG